MTDVGAVVAPDDPITRRGRSVLRVIARNPVAIACVVFLSALTVCAVIAPWITPFDPSHTDLALANTPPGAVYLLGGDASGRDVLSRLIAASTVTVIAAVTATVVAALVGVPGGLVAGYLGGAWDGASSFVSNVLITIPGLVALIALYTVIGPAIVPTMALFGLLLAPSFFRLVRGTVHSIRNELYIDAARVAGLTNRRIIARHVLRVIQRPVIVQAAFVAGTAVSIQAGLEFLGLGNPGVSSYGGMLRAAFVNIYAAPLEIVWPGIALGLTVASLVLLGNVIRDSLSAGGRVAPRRSARPPRPHSTTDAAPSDDGVVLRIDGLRIAFAAEGGTMNEVVRNASLHVREGEILGLVGQSGSGKTQIAFAVLGISAPEAILLGGSIRVAGEEMVNASARRLQRARRSIVSYIPQEPMVNLDPSYRVGTQLVYGLRSATGISRSAARSRILALFERVGIVDSQRTFDSFPHEISGGMAQRALIAAAVAGEPRLLIADEPTTALDVTVQAEILDLLRDLQREHHLAVLLVTHNLGVVADLCERVAVMHQGRIVEEGAVAQVLRNPRDAYTRRLLDAVLDEDQVRPALPLDQDVRG